MHLVRVTIKHTKTDTACRHYRSPRTALARWIHKRGHGRQCWICVPSIAALMDPKRMTRP